MASPRRDAQDPEVLAIAEALYGRPLAEFIEQRTAAVRGLDTSVAAPVRALRKPSPAAWLVDQLVRADAADVDGAIDLGVQLQHAQAEGDSDRIRELSRRHRDEVRRLTERAREIAGSSAVKASAAVLDEVAQTVSAAMSDAGAAAAVRSGLLVRSLRSTGFEPVEVDDALALTGLPIPEPADFASSGSTSSSSGSASPSGDASSSEKARDRAAARRDRLAEERRRRDIERQRARLQGQRDRAVSDADRLARELDDLERTLREKRAALSEARELIVDLDRRLDAL